MYIYRRNDDGNRGRALCEVIHLEVPTIRIPKKFHSTVNYTCNHFHI